MDMIHIIWDMDLSSFHLEWGRSKSAIEGDDLDFIKPLFICIKAGCLSHRINAETLWVDCNNSGDVWKNIGRT